MLRQMPQERGASALSHWFCGSMHSTILAPARPYTAAVSPPRPLILYRCRQT